MSEAAERKRFDLGDYVEVKDRIKLFYELYGNGRLTTERVEILTAPDGKQRVMVHAQAFRSPDDTHPGDGYSWLEIPGTTPYTKGSEVENAETSAWGRAIGSLGILIDRSIASQNEIDAKAGSNLTVIRPKAPTHEATSDGGLVGIAKAGEAPADYQIREEPDGWALSFKLMDGRKGFRVVARDDLAAALAPLADSVIGQRVTCWGRMGTDSFPKDGKTITYNVLYLERIATPDFTLPANASSAGNPDDASTPDSGGASSTAEAPRPQASAATPVEEEPEQPPKAEAVKAESGNTPLQAPVEADVAPASALCGSPSPYGDDEACDLLKGHRGVHKVVSAPIPTSWGER